MGLPVNSEPGVGVSLVLANAIAHFGMKNLRPAARQAAQASVLEFGKNIARRPAGQTREPIPFDGRVRLEVQPRVGLVDDADDVEIPLVGQLMVQAADDVQLGRPAPVSFGGPLQDLRRRS